MPLRILLSTTSYQDTPGPHHQRLDSLGASIHRVRGPLNEQQMLDIVGEFDAFLCGDDAITRTVLEKSLPRLRVISKYGIGVDKIDIASCSEFGIPVTFCPGVNHTTVAEHVILLILATLRNLHEHASHVHQGNWKRMTGHELLGKRLGIVGLGRIGQEVAKRAAAFEMSLIGYGANYWPEDLASNLNMQRAATLDELFAQSDMISLNTRLTDQSRNLIRRETIERMKDGVVIVNCGRGELVHTADLVAALESGKIGGYAADVLDQEPPHPDHPLLHAPRCLITPHIASRTFESVERQAMMATENLIRCLNGEPPLAKVN